MQRPSRCYDDDDRPTPPRAPAAVLPLSVAAALARLEAEVGQAADPQARARLAGLGEAAASRAVRRIWENRHGVRRLSAYVMRMAEMEAMERNAAGTPAAESAASQDDSILGPLYDDEDQMEVQSPDPGITFRFSNQARFQPASSVQKTPCRLQNEQKRDAYTGPFPYSNGMEVESSPLGWTSPGGLHNQPPFSSVASSAANPGRSEAGYPEYEMPDSPARDDTPSPVLDITRRVQQMDGPSGRVGVATPPPLATENALMATKAPPPRTVSTTRGHVSFPSPQMIALGELEFDRVFLIYVYLADRKIEEVLEDVNYIMYLKSLPMDCFEPEIWNRFGHESLPASDRRKNIDWDPSTTRLYYCNVEKRHDSIVTIFKGPYVDNTRTHLQKIVGDDNVLIVKFADIPGLTNSADNFGIYCMYYRQVAEDGIFVGLRRYRFFIHKDGGKEKQKEEQEKAENKKFSPSVRCYFVCIESGWNRDVPYILSGCTIDQARRRFMHIHNAPTVSKYLARFALILSKTITLHVDFSEVNIIIIEDEPCKDEHGNIVTNDAGEPLIHTGTGLISFDLAMKCPVSVFKGNFLKGHELQDTMDSEKYRYLISYPLLIQFRMFYNGNAVKGTVLADKRLPDNTIHIRPSMIKINGDENSLGGQSFNAFEVVTTSDNRQVSGKVLVYKHPGLHFGDIHKLTATYIDGLEEIVGDSKYAIFFPTSGSRSLADEMANSDFDGDMYWVSWNPQLLKHFKPGEPWEHKNQPKNTKQKKPQDYGGSELESLLFCEFLRARFSPSYVLGTSANCWLTLMDRLLTPGVSQSEKDLIKINMLELVDIYYWSLDAPKNGNKVVSNHGLVCFIDRP